MSRSLLSQKEIEDALLQLESWQLVEGKLERNFKFNTFADAFAFMTKVALQAEKIDHHPDWSNSFNKVNVSLTTHSSGGISQLDIDLAIYINSLDHI